MGIFKNITRTLKKAAPIIGGTIGFMIGGPKGAALGSGIGSLAGGRSTKEALMAAALGYGAGSLGRSMGYGPTAAKLTSVATPVSGAAYGPETLIPQISKTAAPTSFFDKAIGFAKTPTGIATIGGTLGLGALALGEEEEKKGTMRPYPIGKTRLGMGRIGDTFYNLDDEEERKQYFEDLKKISKDDEEAVTMSSGGLYMLGETINRGLHNQIKGRSDQIQPFLDQVGDMAQEKFGVDVTKNPTGMPSLGGGLGMPNANQLGNRLPAFTDDMANRLFEAGKNQMGSNAYAPSGNSRSDIIDQQYKDNVDVSPAYLPIDQGDGIDQFGKPMEATGSTAPTDPTKALELFGNAFNRGVTSSPSSSFGGGSSSLAGIGSMRRLFMNTGGEVEGPGTGTSDSVPARLSDGEFVLTAKAVRGAGGGDRDLGAARMYDMMSELERVA